MENENDSFARQDIIFSKPKGAKAIEGDEFREKTIAEQLLSQTRSDERTRESEMQRSRQEAGEMEERQQIEGKKDRGKIVTLH